MILVFVLSLTVRRWMLPDRAFLDISREAGLKDLTLKCTGVPSIGIRSNTSMASGLAVVVKGNRSAPSLWDGCLRMGIGNENDQVK